MRVFLRFGDAQLLQPLGGYIFPDRVHHVVFIEKDMQSLEFSIVRSHRAIMQRQGFHTVFRHIFLSQHDGQLLCPIVAEVKEDHGITLLYRA